MSIEHNAYRTGIKSNGEIKVFQFLPSLEFDVVINRFREFAVNNQLHNIIKCLAIADNTKVCLFKTPGDICASVIETAEGKIPVIEPWDFDKNNDYKDYNLDFIWDGNQLFAYNRKDRKDRNDRNDRWILVTEYETYSLIEERGQAKFNDLITSCYRGKWLPKGSNFFKKLKEFLYYSSYPIVADDFKSSDSFLLDELDTIVQNEPLYVKGDLRQYKYYSDWDEYEYSLDIVKIPEWLKVENQ